jgi:hypothetical protein
MTRLPNTDLLQGGMAQPEIDPTLQRLFQQKQASNPLLGKGTLLQFIYLYWQHDPRPLVIVTDVIYGQLIRGVNLHYLSFNDIRKILQQGCNNKSFSYRMFAPPPNATPQQKNTYPVTRAFRTYKWHGIRTIKQLDCDFILKIMAMVRSFNPAEVEIIRKQVQEQLRRQVNTTTETPAQEPVAPTGQQVPLALPETGE